VPGPIVLVGHSYGGAVITNAAKGNTNVKALVYVAAFIPDAGETAPDLFKFPGSMIVLPPADHPTVTPSPFPGGVDFYVNADVFPHDLRRRPPDREDRADGGRPAASKRAVL